LLDKKNAELELLKQIAATLEITTKSNMLLLAATLKSLYLGVNVTCSIRILSLEEGGLGYYQYAFF